MSTLYIRLPSKAAADGAEHWLTLPCPFAVGSQGDAVEREGVCPLSELAGAVATAQRVVLLLAASDVSLLRVKTPPLSAAKLRLALPNLVEDQLMADPTECVVVPGNLADGLRTAAVVQRGWLDILSKTFTSYGARSLFALPAQLCLPYHEGKVSAAITEQNADIDITLRTSEQEGIGLPIMPEASEIVVAEVLAALKAIVPSKPIVLYVPRTRVMDYQEALKTNNSAQEQDIGVFADNWSRWVGEAGKVTLNLMSGLGAGSGPQVNWRQWRWAIVLTVLLLLVNAFGLNIDWWRMKHEASSLRAGMLQTYKSTYPKETVILDVVAQMHRKIADAERDAGQAAPDDFGQIAANFGEALASQVKDSKERKGGVASIVSLEYRERSLFVHLKPDSQASQGLMEKMKISLAARNLALTSPSNGVWQIRSEK